MSIVCNGDLIVLVPRYAGALIQACVSDILNSQTWPAPPFSNIEFALATRHFTFGRVYRKNITQARVSIRLLIIHLQYISSKGLLRNNFANIRHLARLTEQSEIPRMSELDHKPSVR